MQNITEKSCLVLVWSIENFSCWNSEIHGNVIMSPESAAFTIKMYPRGLSGNEAHLVVHIASHRRLFDGNLSFIGSDGSELCTQQMDSGEDKRLLELPPGPKFDEVVTQIKKNETLHGDRLILRCQMWSLFNDIEHLQTTIDALAASLKIYPDAFNEHSIGIQCSQLMKFPLHTTKLTPMLLISKKQQSKIILSLSCADFERKFSVRTRMSVLNNEDVVMRTEEKEHLFRSKDSWDFCSSLTIEEVKERGFSLILHFKIIPSSEYTHSFGLYQYSPFKMDIMQTNSISRPLETGVPEQNTSRSMSTVTSHKLDSSIAVLTSELMCLYQDQDFSDLQLKCGDVSIPVHRAILSARSPVFKTMLSSDMREAAPNQVNIGDLDPSTLSRFLTFLYTGGVENLEGESALKLYYAADKYQVPSLKGKCVDFLCDNVSVSNVCDILPLANRHQDDLLIRVAKDFFLSNYNEVLASEGWKKFMKSEPLLAVETVTEFGEKKCVGKIGSA